MQYIVTELLGNTAVAVNSKIFDKLADTVKYILKENKNQVLFIDGKPFTEELVRESLKERLSTVSITNNTEPHVRWFVTAF